MSGESSRRTSTASTSSLPRTPASAHFERDAYNWTDPGRLPLVGAFSSPVYDSETSSNLSHTLLTPSVATGNALARIGEEQDVSWQDEPKITPVRSLTISSPYPVHHNRISRSATLHSPSYQSAVRPWPKPPSTAPEADGPNLWEEAQRLSIVEDELDDTFDELRSRSVTPESEGDTLKRRRHIRRPSRQRPEQPRPLPSLPTGLVHSQSTSGRYVTAPEGTVLASTEPMTSDLRRRSHTLNFSPPTVRALPNPSRPIPDKRMPQLKLATLELRSLPSEAAAVLTKTPNRPSNPLGNLFTAPPMPADASTQLDWDLIGDALEVDGEMTATPVGLPRDRR